MTSKEALKNICSECELLASKQFKRCPFRSISNEHCDDYDIIANDLDKLEKLEHRVKMQKIEIKELKRKLKKYGNEQSNNN